MKSYRGDVQRSQWMGGAARRCSPGLVAAATARVTGIPYARRRGRAMSLPAGMQWDLLPPLSAHTAGR